MRGPTKRSLSNQREDPPFTPEEASARRREIRQAALLAGHQILSRALLRIGARDQTDEELDRLERNLDGAIQGATGATLKEHALLWLETNAERLASRLRDEEGNLFPENALPDSFPQDRNQTWAEFGRWFPDLAIMDAPASGRTQQEREHISQLFMDLVSASGRSRSAKGGRPERRLENPKRTKVEALMTLALELGLIERGHDAEHLRHRLLALRERVTTTLPPVQFSYVVGVLQPNDSVERGRTGRKPAQSVLDRDDAGQTRRKPAPAKDK